MALVILKFFSPSLKFEADSLGGFEVGDYKWLKSEWFKFVIVAEMNGRGTYWKCLASTVFC